MSDRCPWAVRYGANLVTRCFLAADHDPRAGHQGRGRKDTQQVITWYPGDAREFESTSNSLWAWEITQHRERRRP